MKLLLQSTLDLKSYLLEVSGILSSEPDIISDNVAIYDLHEPISDSLKNQLNVKQIDFAIFDKFISLNEFSLCVMDMDSTLISIECIDEIADMCGKKEDVARITKSAMMGEIDFSQSLIKRVSLLEGLDEAMLFKVVKERLKFNPGTKAWVEACRKNNITTVLVSGGFDYFADYVKDALGIDVAISNYFDTQIWFKFTDTINGNFSIENVYVNQEEYYSDCLHCCEFDYVGARSSYVSGF